MMKIFLAILFFFSQIGCTLGKQPIQTSTETLGNPIASKEPKSTDSSDYIVKIQAVKGYEMLALYIYRLETLKAFDSKMEDIFKQVRDLPEKLFFCNRDSRNYQANFCYVVGDTIRYVLIPELEKLEKKQKSEMTSDLKNLKPIYEPLINDCTGSARLLESAFSKNDEYDINLSLSEYKNCLAKNNTSPSSNSKVHSIVRQPDEKKSIPSTKPETFNNTKE